MSWLVDSAIALSRFCTYESSRPSGANATGCGPARISTGTSESPGVKSTIDATVPSAFDYTTFNEWRKPPHRELQWGGRLARLFGDVPNVAYRRARRPPH